MTEELEAIFNHKAKIMWELAEGRIGGNQSVWIIHNYSDKGYRTQELGGFDGITFRRFSISEVDHIIRDGR